MCVKVSHIQLNYIHYVLSSCQQFHHCSGLATLPSVGAIPLSPCISVD